MKKLLTILSAFAITTTVVPTMVACSKEDEAILDLNKITADMILNSDI